MLEPTISNVDSKGVDIPSGRRDAVAWADKNRRYLDTGIMGEDNSVDDGEFGKRT